MKIFSACPAKTGRRQQHEKKQKSHCFWRGFVAHIWRTRGAQNHEMCTKTIKSYKKHIPKKWLIYAIYGNLREDKKGENFIS